MAKKRKVSDIATQRGTSVDDVLAHLKKAGIEVVDGEVSVDEAAIEKAYAAPAAGGEYSFSFYMPENVQKPAASPIRDRARYHGVSLTLDGFLDGARCKVKIDIGFGDVVAFEVEHLLVALLARGALREHAPEVIGSNDVPGAAM